MTESQFLVLLATIWVAPHTKEWYGMFIGFLMLIFAVLKGLGWI